MFASHESVGLGACRDGIRREHTAQDCANLACAAAATVGSLRRLLWGLGLDARRQHEKAFAQSERARVAVGGLCEVSPPAVAGGVLVRRQPFIGPVGQGCRMHRVGWVVSLYVVIQVPLKYDTRILHITLSPQLHPPHHANSHVRHAREHAGGRTDFISSHPLP